MPPTVYIQRLRLEASTPDAATGRRLPEQLSQSFRTELLAVLTEELERHDVPGQLRQLPELVLHLPPIPAGQLHRELPRQLRAALRQALAAWPPLPAQPASGSPATRDPTSGGRLPASSSYQAATAKPAASLIGGGNMDSLRHYLLHGRLLWPLAASNFDLDASLRRALHAEPTALHRLLHQLRAQPAARQRLTWQATSATLSQLRELAASRPGTAPWLRSLAPPALSKEAVISAAGAATWPDEAPSPITRPAHSATGQLPRLLSAPLHLSNFSILAAPIVVPGRVRDWLRWPGRSVASSGGWQVAGTHSLAAAWQVLTTYLLAAPAVGQQPRVGAMQPGVPTLRALLRWQARRQPAAVLALLGQPGASTTVWPRLVALADFATIGLLLAEAAGPSQAARHLASLDALTPQLPGGVRGVALLKTACLLAVLHPSELSGPAGRQLVALYALPGRALGQQLARRAAQYPALAALPGLHQLLAALSATTLPDAQPVTEPAVRQLLAYVRQGLPPGAPTPPANAARLAAAWRRVGTAAKSALLPYLAEPAARQRLAGLGGFAYLAMLRTAPALGAAQYRVLRPALVALDRQARRDQLASQPHGQLWRWLHEVYATEMLAPGPVASPAAPLAVARQLAAAYGLSWRLGQRWAGALLRQLPSLAADPFWAAWWAAARVERRWPRRPPRHLLPLSETGLATLLHYLQTGQPGPTGQPQPALLALLHADGQELAQRLRPYLSQPTTRQRLLALWPIGWLPRLLPATYRPLAALARAWQQLHAAGRVRTTAGLPDILAAAAGPAPPAELVHHLLLAEAAATGRQAGRVAGQLLRHLAPPGQLVIDEPLAQLAARLAAHLPVGSSPSATADRLPAPLPTSLLPQARVENRPSPATELEPAYVANAGLVLLWPFLTRLFERLGYLEQRQWRTADAVDRATHLLQFLATGGEQFPEFELVLNKVLCGVPQAQPLPRRLQLTDEEQATGLDLLRAVLAQWPVLKNTSVAGLRETFLLRPGKLAWHPDHLALTVETRTVDILLDQCPWSVAVIRLPWMPLPLYVTWR